MAASPIPGVPDDHYHPREEWEQPAYPVDGPRAVWANIDTGALHYTGADDLIDGDPGENWADMGGYIAAIQRNYVTQRGYSIGYMWAVDQRGHVWQLRGPEYKSAANRGWNHRTAPILLLVDGQDMASPMAVEAANRVFGYAQGRAGRGMAVKPHNQIGPTQCPGVGISAQYRAGVFVPYTGPVPVPPPPGGSDVIQPIEPFRNSDTRRYGTPLQPNRVYEFALDAQIPANVVAAHMSVAAIGQGLAGWVRIWPKGQNEPDTSAVNFEPYGATSSGLVVGTSGRRFMVKVNRAAHLIVDVNAYWTP